MKLIERIVVGTIAVIVVLGTLSALLPPLIPSLIVLCVLVVALRLVWFYTRSW